jgi:two-component system sensor histidine kinase EvgS
MMDADRNHSGILADILAVLNNAIGQKIETRLVEGAVSDTHEVAKEDGIYGSASILKTSRHANEYLLTDPFMTTPFYIYATTKNRKEIRRPVDLKGKRVAVPRNHRAVAAYLAGIGGVQTIPVDTPLEQMQKVVSGEADVLIGYFTYPYLVNKYLMVDLVIAFIARSDQGIHIGVNPEHPVLLGILNKAIATIGEKQVASITAKWTETSRERISRAELTPEEKDWLNKKHTVRVRVGNHPPWSMNTPEPKGMAIDYLNIIGELYGISFNFVPDNEPWIEGFKDLAGKHLRFDLYPTATRTLERLEYLAMSQTYLSSPWVIFTRVSSTDILRVEDLRGRKVAAERGYVMQKRLEATEPRKTPF